MKNIKSVISRLTQKFSKKKLMPYQLSLIGYEIFLLKLNFYLGHEVEIDDLVIKYTHELITQEVDIISNQMNYAIKIANSENRLEQEEIYKLFSLCDEIYSLEQLNIPVNLELKYKYRDIVNRRLKIEGKIAKRIAKDRLQEWNTELWWYNL